MTGADATTKDARAGPRLEYRLRGPQVDALGKLVIIGVVTAGAIGLIAGIAIGFITWGLHA